MLTTDHTVVHAYGVVTAGTELPIDTGIDGSPLALVDVGEFAIVSSHLSAYRYGLESWREHAMDPEWLQDVVQQHHLVLQAITSTADVVPLRLPAIHSDLTTLRQVVTAQRGELTAAARRIRGHIEMGVKVFAGDEKSMAIPPAEEAMTGRDYLNRRSREATQIAARLHQRVSAVNQIHATLSHSASSAIINPPQHPALSGRDQPMLLNGAYLVLRHRLHDFLNRADSAGGCGLLVEITGPWPPYNFTDSAQPEEPVP
jgi:hypothetical protein